MESDADFITLIGTEYGFLGRCGIVKVMPVRSKAMPEKDNTSWRLVLSANMPTRRMADNRVGRSMVASLSLLVGTMAL